MINPIVISSIQIKDLKKIFKIIIRSKFSLNHHFFLENIHIRINGFNYIKYIILLY